MKAFTLNKKDINLGNRTLPLLAVWSWEIRRVFAKPLNWLFGIATFLFFLGMMWFKHAWTLGTDTGISFTLYGTSAIGLLYEYSVVLMLVFAFILPFIVTEGVARDYKIRIHELLMATPLPTPAYVWGRFLAVVTIGLGQAVLMLVAALLMGTILHVRNAVYPQPGLNNLVVGWGLIVIPATIFITEIGFSLGTLWPRRTKMIMLGILITWILFFTVGDILRINPTGVSILGNLIPRLILTANTNLPALPAEQRTVWIQQLQATLPDLKGWVLPQYALSIAGVLLVTVAVAGFRRFRKELE